MDCSEILKFLKIGHIIDDPDSGCCLECLNYQISMLQAPVQRRIYTGPPSLDGSNRDWGMNIEAVVCCHHHHITSAMTREDWLGLAKAVDATPFISGEEFAAHVDRSSRSAHRSHPKKEVRQRETILKTYPCQFCGTPTPPYGKCKVCFG